MPDETKVAPALGVSVSVQTDSASIVFQTHVDAVEALEAKDGALNRLLDALVDAGTRQKFRADLPAMKRKSANIAKTLERATNDILRLDGVIERSAPSGPKGRNGEPRESAGDRVTRNKHENDRQNALTSVQRLQEDHAALLEHIAEAEASVGGSHAPNGRADHHPRDADRKVPPVH